MPKKKSNTADSFARKLHSLATTVAGLSRKEKAELLALIKQDGRPDALMIRAKKVSAKEGASARSFIKKLEKTEARNRRRSAQDQSVVQKRQLLEKAVEQKLSEFMGVKLEPQRPAGRKPRTRGGAK